MDLILIAAVAKNGVIGNKGEMAWEPISEDLMRFKDFTMGHPVIMGRTTYNSIPQKFRPLAGRVNIVLSANRNFMADGIVVCRSINEALGVAGKCKPPIYIGGGQNVYEQTIDLASKLELTELNRSYSGDAFFPKVSKCDWKETCRTRMNDYSFVSYMRK